MNDTISKPQVGDKITIKAAVIIQNSTPVATLSGIKYSHYHVLRDEDGHLYKYKGSSHFPLHNIVHITALIKGYTVGDSFGNIVTVIKAPKVIAA